MTKRTTEQWEALLDGTADGPWEVKHHGDDLVVSICTTVHDPKRFVGDFYGEWNARLAAAAPEAVAEVVRLHRALEEQLKELSDELEAEGVETYDDIDGTWPSMQRYGELSEIIAQRNFLTRILEGDTDE